ncbi:MAG: hypothetical protein RLZZ15_3418 [Verrucomicrobiota bacterium]|jgi:hypothetical protein
MFSEKARMISPRFSSAPAVAKRVWVTPTIELLGTGDTESGAKDVNELTGSLGCVMNQNSRSIYTCAS